MNALEILQAVCYESNIPAPTSIVGSTDPATLQLLYLLYSTGRELVEAECWIQLKRTHTITTDGSSEYPLPSDYHSMIMDTFWDTEDNRRLGGPLTDSKFTQLKYGYAAVGDRIYYRPFGRNDTDQIQMVTAPESGIDLTFDYMSNAWIFASPSTWQTTVTNTTNTFAFDDDLLILGLKYKLFQAKGWAYQPFEMEFKRRIGQAQARWKGSFKTSLYAAGTYTISPNIPEGDFPIT